MFKVENITTTTNYKKKRPATDRSGNRVPQKNKKMQQRGRAITTNHTSSHGATTTHTPRFPIPDRGKFSYPALLGRRFMRDDDILIDSADPFLAQNECEYVTLEELAEAHKDKLLTQ